MVSKGEKNIQRAYLKERQRLWLYAPKESLTLNVCYVSRSETY
jgi:hypothetical protein